MGFTVNVMTNPPTPGVKVELHWHEVGLLLTKYTDASGFAFFDVIPGNYPLTVFIRAPQHGLESDLIVGEDLGEYGVEFLLGESIAPASNMLPVLAVIAGVVWLLTQG